MKLGAVGDEYVQDEEGVCVADEQGAGALAVVVLADVDGVARGVPADGGRVEEAGDLKSACSNSWHSNVCRLQQRSASRSTASSQPKRVVGRQRELMCGGVEGEQNKFV
jgi:hypothetical protein